MADIGNYNGLRQRPEGRAVPRQKAGGDAVSPEILRLSTRIVIAGGQGCDLPEFVQE
jgi:hypothetical protein